MSCGEDKIVEAKDIQFSYNGFPVLRNISFCMGKEFMVIMGPNGSGKTTLIKLIMGLLKPERGEIKVFGKLPEKVRGKIGYMPQRENVADHIPIRVGDVVLMGASAKRFPGKDEIMKARKALKEVDMLHLWNRPFNHLSGGQKQRVMFARAIAGEPSLIIMDEPFNGVDIPSREKIIDALLRRLREGIGLIMVLHNINPVVHQVDKVLLLNREMISFGRPNDVLNEENLMKVYGGTISIVRCKEGYCHPLIGDEHG